MPEEKKRSMELNPHCIRGGLEFVMPEVYEKNTMNKVGCSDWMRTVFNELGNYVKIASITDLAREIASELERMKADPDFLKAKNGNKLLKHEHREKLIDLAKRALEAFDEEK